MHVCVYMYMYIRNTHFTRSTVKTLAAASLSNALQSMEVEDCYLKWGDYSFICSKKSGLGFTWGDDGYPFGTILGICWE